MRSPLTALLAALPLVLAGVAPTQSAEEKPPARVTLPAGLAERLGEDPLPEVVWVGLHPTRNDGAWVLFGDEWTLVTGLREEVQVELKDARKRPSQTPPVRPPNVGVTLHVVRFERP